MSSLEVSFEWYLHRISSTKFGRQNSYLSITESQSMIYDIIGLHYIVLWLS